MTERGAQVLSYDILLDQHATEQAIRRRMVTSGAEPAAFDELLSRCDYVLAVTPAQQARQTAAKAAPLLRIGQIYCDLASTSPDDKREMAAAIGAVGAQFVEGVILGAVAASSASPAILLGGQGGESLACTLQNYGLRARFYSIEIGRASAFKLLRSVFSKGMECLLIESLVAARRAGLFEEVWQEIRTTLPGDGVQRMLETWIRSHAVSSERRYIEMQEVNRFLVELEADPIVTCSVVELFRRSSEMAIGDHFAGGEPHCLADVVDFIANRLPAGSTTALSRQQDASSGGESSN
jgi:3-hydroxyisobutyrate dehydrogenase-like beta-hydroxyacid dehydrogenase